MGTDDLATAHECDYDPAREQLRAQEHAMAEEEARRRRADVAAADEVEAPEELDLRPYGLMIKAGAEHAGRFWLEEMRERGHDISAIPVVYFNIAGEECRVEVAL